MKQILQSLADGETAVVDVPRPAISAGKVRIGSTVSLLSAGTERMLVEFGRGNLLSKARQQPDKVKNVIEKIGTDGVFATLDAVRSKLDQPLALGYCNVGRVVEVGSDAAGLLLVGDRVVSNGKHAETVVVPKNLCARIPDEVEDESAAFTVLGAIALQGVRLIGPTIGEAVAVMGLGLVGLLTVQILRANGCRVLGIDMNPQRLALAAQLGAQVVDLSKVSDPTSTANTFSRGRGLDAVILTASTKSNEPVSQAAAMSRKRGRIVLVGITGLELSRADFYEKELSFQVSCSYGPGRYDASYEDEGQDYPIGFVRWTEQRNFEAVLDLMASGVLDVKPLISHRFHIDSAAKAYDLLASNEPSLGILLRYSQDLDPAGSAKDQDACVIPLIEGSRTAGKGIAGFIGAGNYGGRVLISAFRDAGATLDTLVSAGGVSAVHYGKKFGFCRASTDVSGLLTDRNIDTVVICTRHNTHAAFAQQALAAGKHVFVEKPLCLTLDELAGIESALREGYSSNHQPLLMVGFNRRFAPQVEKMKWLLEGLSAPKSFVMTVNTGAIPNDHWTQNPAIGGGRIVGEACHFIDLLRHLAGARISDFHVARLEEVGGPPTSDKVSVTLQFEDGSCGALHYLANGHKSYPKERLEVFCAGRVLQLDNFHTLRGWGWRSFSRMKLWRQNKGQKACAAAFIQAVRDGSKPPIPVAEIFEVARVSIEVQQAIL